MITNTGSAILNRLIDPEAENLSPEAARSLLQLDFAEMDHQRMSELSLKAQSAEFTDSEREELQEYLHIADLLAVLQSRARRSLQRLGRAS
jgi:hypothetical protein